MKQQYSDDSPKVISMVGNDDGTLDGCAVWRVLQPATELNRQGYRGVGWDFMDNPMVARIVTMYDAISLPRRHWEPEHWDRGRQWVDMVHGWGMAVFFEVDDDMFSEDFVDRLVSSHGKTAEQAEKIRMSTVHTLDVVDGVTVSSQRLATLVRSIKPDMPVEVVPNFIDHRWFMEVQRGTKRQTDKLTIGWAGGARPDYDLELMAAAWARIAAEYPKVHFVVQGYHPPAIADRIDPSRLTYIDWLPIDQYPAGMIEIDIGCCPLSNTFFNRCKTNIKAMEYGLAGSAVVASPTVYGRIIKSGANGYIASTEQQWYNRLRLLVESPTKRHRLGKALKQTVLAAHTLEKNAWRWPVAWSNLLEHYRRGTAVSQIAVPSRRILA